MRVRIADTPLCLAKSFVVVVPVDTVHGRHRVAEHCMVPVDLVIAIYAVKARAEELADLWLGVHLHQQERIADVASPNVGLGSESGRTGLFSHGLLMTQSGQCRGCITSKTARRQSLGDCMFCMAAVISRPSS